MGVIAEIAHRVVVMYAAARPRSDRNSTSFDRRATPTLGATRRGTRADVKTRRLVTIPGNAVRRRGADRLCVRAALSVRMDICAGSPPLRGARDHLDACWLSDEQRLESDRPDRAR